MVLFPSEEWVKETCEALSNSELYSEDASDWEKTSTFVIEKDPEHGLEEDKYYWMDLWHGECKEACEMDSPDEKETDFTFTAPLREFKKLFKKEMTPNAMLLRGIIELDGDMAYMMKHMPAADAFTEVIIEDVGVEFPEMPEE